MVQVDKQQGGIGIQASTAFQYARELFIEAAPVRQAGERVVVGEVAESVLLPLQRIEGVARSQHVLNIAPQQGPVDRLGLVLGGPRLESGVDGLAVVRTSHNHDGYGFALRQLANSFADFQAGHTRHFHVQEYQVGPFAHENIQCFVPIGSFNDDHALGFKALACQQAHVLVIVADQDFCAMVGPFFIGHWRPGLAHTHR